MRIEVVKIDYDGNSRRGLTATCRREDGTNHTVAGSEVVFPKGSDGRKYVAAYRKWLGLDPSPPGETSPKKTARRHKAAEEDIDRSLLPSVRAGERWEARHDKD